MKLFKKLRDHGRSSEIPATTSSSSSSSSSPSPLSPSCASDHRAANGVTAPTAPSPPSPSDATRAAPTAGDRRDFMSSEEEYQVQLALAISDSEFRNDLYGDQIRAAKLLSLGKHRIDPIREEESTADALSRRYWEYNVLDYNEKILDGFYDVFGLSTSANQGKLPSLIDLQNGNLGFEAIVVNHSLDTALIELEQVTQCILLDCPVAEVGILVQRVSELVAEHMGGPVRDVNTMFVRWLENSTDLRTSLQTSALPIGCTKIGLSRHRALLFKVLADKVGIPCKLVKGSHYTGVDDDAINIIKLDHEREFLLDLMSAPGTLIPADVPSRKDMSLNSYNPKMSENPTSWAAGNPSGDLSRTEQLHGGVYGTSAFADNNAFDKRSRYEKPVLLPSVQSGGTSSVSNGSSSNTSKEALSSNDQKNHFLPSVSSTSKQKDIAEAPVDASALTSEQLNVVPHSPDAEDSGNLFAELNPFKVTGAGKIPGASKANDNKKTEQQRRRESNISGPGRPQHPLVWKNRPACNEVPNPKQHNIVEGLFPRKDIAINDLNASSSLHPSTSDVKASSTASRVPVIQDNDLYTGHAAAQASVQQMLNEPSEMNTSESHMGLQSTVRHELKEQEVKFHDKHDRRKFKHDRFMGTDMMIYNPETAASSSELRMSRLDPMLVDVAECEILWEDLVIGERIGLGSYGEVYHADWKGKEVAVKKFLDQDFYGDALDEFRSEVRIMRRLRHPNVVLFMGAVTRPPNLSIVSEFLPRGSLYRILHRPNCQIDERRRIKMALDVAQGMNCLHTSTPTIVHRDLKSPNLLVDKNWTVKVCDFGLSRLKHSTFLSSKSTAGTPEWMAPEVLRNEPSNEKCDVYSFGVILWELATLTMPWSGMNPMQVVGAVGFQDRRLEIPKDVDPLVARIIWECWQTDPSLRPSFAQLTIALMALPRLVISPHQDAQNPPVPQEISVNSNTLSF